MKENLQKIKEEILKKVAEGEADEAELERRAAEKVERVLMDCLPDFNADVFNGMADEIKAYMNGGEAQRRKLLNYSLDFADPTADEKPFEESGETIQLQRYLQDSEIEKLKKFVDSHRMDVSFGEIVSRIMDKRGIQKQSTVYNSVFMRRQDFCNAVSVAEKNVSKRNAWHIIIGLKCSLEEVDELLFSAGHFRRRNAFDLIMQYFIETKNYDIMAINEMLYDYGLKVFSLEKQVKDSDTK